jgi:hypothetical protein
MRYYRDLQPGETLQVGDMWRLANDSDAEWQTITADDIAEAPEGGLTVTSVEESGIEYRRPVDAVPCEEHERLRQRLAEAESLLGEAMRDGQQLYAEVGRAAITAATAASHAGGDCGDQAARFQECCL